jgi:hypothetical protein
LPGWWKIRCAVREEETDLVYDHPENGGSMLLEMSVSICYPVRTKRPSFEEQQQQKPEKYIT